MLFLAGSVYFWSKGLSFVALSHAIIAGVLVLFMIYLRRKEQGALIIVSESNVVLPSLTGQRIIQWSELTNVIKRDDMLTIDFKSNKVDARSRSSTPMIFLKMSSINFARNSFIKIKTQKSQPR
jgi:hypothetical protein